MAKKLYVGNLPDPILETDLNDLFSQVGEVRSVQIVIKRTLKRNTSFALIEMANDQLAQDALARFHRQDFQGRALKVQFALPKHERPKRSVIGGTKKLISKVRKKALTGKK